MLVNDPGLQDSTVFNARRSPYYGRWTYKLEEAARRGALGAILIHTTESATYPWDVVRGSWSVEQFQTRSRGAQGLGVRAWSHTGQCNPSWRSRLEARLAGTGVAGGAISSPFATGTRVAVDITSALRRVQSENVVAKLPGAIPGSASQVVMFTATLGPQGHRARRRWRLDLQRRGGQRVRALPRYSRRRKRWPHMTPGRETLLFARRRRRRADYSQRSLCGGPARAARAHAAGAQSRRDDVRGATHDIDALGLDRSTLGPLSKPRPVPSRSPSSPSDVRGSF